MNTVTATVTASLIQSLEKEAIEIYNSIDQAVQWLEWQFCQDLDRDREKAIDLSIRDLRSLGLLDFYMGMKAHIATKNTIPRVPFVRKELVPPSRDQGVPIGYVPPQPPAPTLGPPDARVHHRAPQTRKRITDPPPRARRLPMGGERVQKGGIFDPAKFRTPLGSGMGAPVCPKEGITTPPPIETPPNPQTTRRSRRDHAPIWAKTSARSRATFTVELPEPPAPPIQIQSQEEYDLILSLLD